MSIFCEIVSPGRKRGVNGGEIEPGWIQPSPLCRSCLAVPAFEIDQRFPDQNRSAIFILNSISDSRIVIATAIPIKNRSGKTADRFLCWNRSAISGSKSDRDFHFKIDQRLKNRSHCISTVRAINRGSIFVRKSISDFQIKIDQRFSFWKRSAISGL